MPKRRSIGNLLGLRWRKFAHAKEDWRIALIPALSSLLSQGRRFEDSSKLSLDQLEARKKLLLTEMTNVQHDLSHLENRPFHEGTGLGRGCEFGADCLVVVKSAAAFRS